MKLEVGKYYKDRTGEVYGPLRFQSCSRHTFWFLAEGGSWTEEGTYWSNGRSSQSDLIQEVNSDGSPIEPEAKTWGEMTPEEQGALLLAHHNGETIEVYDSRPTKGWTFALLPLWCGSFKYRVKPEPEVKAEVVYWGLVHKITFDTIDGEPDVSTVKMEKL
jgi:hypothetical protein